MPVRLTNAFYVKPYNDVRIIAGILQPPILNRDCFMPLSAMYGKIGFIIANEISHAYDAAGAAYNADGPVDQLP